MSQSQLDRIENKLDELIVTVNERAIDMEGRVTVLETYQSIRGWFATAFSGLVAAVVGAAVGYFGGKP